MYPVAALFVIRGLNLICEKSCVLQKKVPYLFRLLQTSVADPHHFYADPDPDFHFDLNTDAEPSFQINVQNLDKVLK
jgi:hypothetical protein